MCRETTVTCVILSSLFLKKTAFVAWILRNVLIQMFVCYSMQIVYGILLLCNVKGKPITALRRDQTGLLFTHRVGPLMGSETWM